MSRLFGADTALRIQNASIAVIGIGGVGSWSAEALARSGVGRLTLIDMDHVSESNINRQLHALTTTLGQSKVLAMQERIQLINPACNLRTIDDFVTPENIETLLPLDLDFLIDATDQVSAKVALAAWCLKHGKPLVMVGAAGGKKWRIWLIWLTWLRSHMTRSWHKSDSDCEKWVLCFLPKSQAVFMRCTAKKTSHDLSRPTVKSRTAI